MNAIIRPRTLRVNVALASGQPVTLSAVETGPRGLPGQDGANGAQGPQGLQGIQGAPGADGDLPYFASAHAAIAAADKLAGQKVDGTKGHFTVQQLIDMALAYNAGIKTANAPILNLSETWNNGAVAFTGLKYNATDTASLAASLLMDLQVGGVSKATIRKDGRIYSATNIEAAVNLVASSDTSGMFLGAASDAVLRRDAANVLAQRNGVNAQAFRLYNTYANAGVDFERAYAAWNGNIFQLGTDKAGTGAARNVQFIRDGLTHITLGGSVTIGNVNLLFATDNGFDIGASGVNRPRSIYTGATIFSGSGFQAAAAGWMLWGSRSVMQSPADGVIQFSNNAATDFGRLCLGGLTSSFPALKRSGATLQARLADDSAFTFIYGRLGTHANAAVGTITPTHTLTLYDAGGTAYRVPCAV